MTDATQALKQHVTDLRLNLAGFSDTLSGTPDLDVANALAVQQRGLGSLAAVALRYARDPELLALAQRIADQTSGIEVSLKPLQTRLQR